MNRYLLLVKVVTAINTIRRHTGLTASWTRYSTIPIVEELVNAKDALRELLEQTEIALELTEALILEMETDGRSISRD